MSDLTPIDFKRTNRALIEGTSSIFSFPFRIYANEEIYKIVGKFKDYKIRIYPPVSLRDSSVVANVDFPFNKWPEFKYHSAVPNGDRISPPSKVIIKPPLPASAAFDGFRIDVFGPSPIDEIRATDIFVSLFLEWLRVLTKQSWINSIEFQIDCTLQHQFPVDETGAATSKPLRVISVVGAPEGASGVTRDTWALAFSKALSGEGVPRYWKVFHDAQMKISSNEYAMPTLFLVLSLEMARDFHLFRLGLASPELGKAKRASTFHSTDIQKHLTDNLEKLIGRNLETEKPALASALHEMYTARHHIAHGQPPVFSTKT